MHAAGWVCTLEKAAGFCHQTEDIKINLPKRGRLRLCPIRVFMQRLCADMRTNGGTYPTFSFTILSRNFLNSLARCNSNM